jgi:tRNA(Ser,Leu) C12 N-acetylase TAN1
VQTDTTICNNKPDIIIHDSEEGTCMLIEVAIPWDGNVIKKEAEKILKYSGLTKERHTVHVECKNKSDANYNKRQLEPSQNHS